MKTKRLLSLALAVLMTTSLFIVTQISPVEAASWVVTPIQWGQIRASDTAGNVSRTNPAETYSGAGFNNVWYVGTNNGNDVSGDYRESMFAFNLSDVELGYIDAVDASGSERITMDFKTKSLSGTTALPISIYLIPSTITLVADDNYFPTQPTIPLTTPAVTGANQFFNTTGTAIAQGQYHSFMTRYLTARETLQFVPSAKIATVSCGTSTTVEESHSVDITAAIKSYRAQFPSESRFGFVFGNNTVTSKNARQGGANGNSGVTLNIPMSDIRTPSSVSASVANNGRFFAGITVNNTLSTDTIGVKFRSNGIESSVITRSAALTTTTMNVTVPKIIGNNEQYDVIVTLNKGDGSLLYEETLSNIVFYTNTIFFEGNGGVQENNRAIEMRRGVASGTKLFRTEVIDPEFPDFVTRVSTIPTITKQYYEFGGWYKDAALTTPWIIGDEDGVDDNDIDAVTSDITLYAKWVNPTADADSSKTILLPSFDTFVRVDSGQTAAENESAVIGSPNVYADNRDQNFAQIGSNNGSGAYREAYLRYDLSAADVTSILKAANGVNFTFKTSGDTGSNNGTEKVLKAYLLPANKVTALHRYYPTTTGAGVEYNFSQQLGFNYWEAYKQGITVRDFHRNTPYVEKSFIGNTNTEVTIDITELLQQYYIANSEATGFVLALTDFTHQWAINSSRAANETDRPKLYIPAPRVANSVTDAIPVNQAGAALNLATLNGATEIILKDSNSTQPASTPVIVIYENNRLVGVNIVPAANCISTPYLTRIKLDAPLSVPSGSTSAKLIFVDSAENIKPIKNLKLIEPVTSQSY